ncbi:hypothetical protein [Pseudomonas rhizoryzae]|nr:hypothetical protein [Pseudomonas rhizoryzae]
MRSDLEVRQLRLAPPDRMDRDAHAAKVRTAVRLAAAVADR